MDTHLKVLAALTTVLGLCGMLVALLFMLVFGGTAGLIGASGDPGAAVAIPILGAIGLGLVAIAVASSLPGIVIGIGLWQRRSWARIAGIVYWALMAVLWIPIGTVLAAYGLWTLFNKETEKLFAGLPVASPTS